MISRIALALAVAAISTSAAAQSLRIKSWDDLLKPYEAKTNPNVPLAPPQSAAPTTAPVDTGLSTVQLYPANASLVDGCVFEAVGRLPKVEGARVASTNAEFYRSWRSLSDLWNIFVTVDFNGKSVRYRFTCRVWSSGAELMRL